MSPCASGRAVHDRDLAGERAEPPRALGGRASEDHGMSPERIIGAVLLFIGLASFAVFAWVFRNMDAFMVLGVLAVFATGCVLLAWHLFRIPAPPSLATTQPAAAAPSPSRVRLSHVCSTAGVLLLMACALVPEHWYPVALLFIGIALLAIAHVLTPCEERLEKLRKVRTKNYL